MYNSRGFILRSLRAGAYRKQQPRGPGQRRGLRARAGAEAVEAGSLQNWGQRLGGWAPWVLLPASAAALLGSVSHAFHKRDEAQEFSHKHYEASKATHPWIEEISQESQLVMTAEMLMKSEHAFLEDDHMFAAFVDKGIVDDIHGFYEPKSKTFKTIISLGREVCGFPRVVHGGLTAAIIDESFGGLLFALKQQKALNFWGPAYTVALEVAYKSKIAAGSTVLCTTEVESMEGRKLWMKATVSDGPSGKVYATARALFVAPKTDKMIKDVAQYLWRRAFPRD